MKAPMLLALGGLSISTAQAAETGTLTLACEGTVADEQADAKPKPISMGMIVNFTARTVAGLPVLTTATSRTFRSSPPFRSR
jgi:hypothetical protein